MVNCLKCSTELEKKGDEGGYTYAHCPTCNCVVTEIFDIPISDGVKLGWNITKGQASFYLMINGKNFKKRMDTLPMLWFQKSSYRNKLYDIVVDALAQKKIVPDESKLTLKELITDRLAGLFEWDAELRTLIGKNGSKHNQDTDQEQEEQINYIKEPITLQQLEEVYRKWFYIEDMDCLHVTLATALSQQIQGTPVWLMIVAPPSSIKTELIRALGEHTNEFIKPIGDLTKSALFTGYKDGQDLAPKLDGKIGTIKDVTGILSSDEKTRNKVFGDLRDLFDGYAHKQFGGDISEKEHHVHTTIIGGVTPIIEQYKVYLSNCGDRFINYRIRYNANNATIKAMEVVGGIEDTMHAEVKLWTLSFLKQQRIIEVSIPEDLKKEIQEAAEFTAISRTAVARDRHGILLGYPSPENAPRLVKQFTKLIKCIAIIRGRSEVNWEDVKTIKQVAFDTSPEMRVRLMGSMVEQYSREMRTYYSASEDFRKFSPEVITQLGYNNDEVGMFNYRVSQTCRIPKPTTQYIASMCGRLDTKTTKAVMEDMMLLGIVRKITKLETFESEVYIYRNFLEEKELLEKGKDKPEEPDDPEGQIVINVNYWFFEDGFFRKYMDMLLTVFDKNQDATALDKKNI